MTTSKVTTIALPDTTQVKAQADEALEVAREFRVTDDETYKIAGELLSGIKQARTALKATFYDGVNGERNQGPIPLANATWKAALAAFNRHDEPYDQAETLIEGQLKQYRLKQKQEAEKLQQQELFKAQEAKKAQVKALEEKGNKAGAQAVKAAPIVVTTVAPAAPPKLEGTTFRKVWKFRVVDSNAIPREYMSVDETKIRGVVERLGREAKIPGVEVYEDEVVIGRGK